MGIFTHLESPTRQTRLNSHVKDNYNGSSVEWSHLTGRNVSILHHVDLRFRVREPGPDKTTIMCLFTPKDPEPWIVPGRGNL